MKTINKLSLLAVIATACYLSVTTGVGQVFNARDVINNRAVANSPRAKEEFPWLTRTPPLSADARCQGEAENALTKAKKNRAYAASPRVRELFPELARGAAPERESASPPAFAVPASVRNNAIANSPRMREAYPALSREAAGKVPAQVGASRRMEACE